MLHHSHRHRRLGRLRSRRAMVGAALIAVAAAGCGSMPSTALSGTGNGRESAPRISVLPADGAQNVRLDAALAVVASGGRLQTVAIHPANSSVNVPGTISADGTHWTLTGGLDADSRYVVDAIARSQDGSVTSDHSSFATMPRPSQRLTLTVTPDSNGVVGIAMPIVLRFDQPVAPDRQPAVTQRLTVEATPPVVGAWHWFSSTEVHFRPKDYWKSGTKVTLHGMIKGVDAGDGVWGLNDFASAFTVGDKHVSTIDVGSHQMTVTNNDQVIATWPISAGRPANPTLGGNLVVWSKQQDVHMVSTSIGIPTNAPDGYDEHVYWDTAISTNGFFVHAAPWDLAQQGVVNVSHGCVNLSIERATTFFNFSQPGDLVIVQNTPRAASADDGEYDWNVPFEQYANASGAPSSSATPPAGGGL